MILNVAIRVTARLAVSGALLALIVGPALSGDRALLEIIGYSDDARYFAFEEFGIQDGSGFPYANIYVVDLSTDQWVGSPYRARIDSEDADVEDAREEALAQAEASLDELEIDIAAHIIALNGDGEPASDTGDELAFGTPGFGLDPVTDVRTLTLETQPATPGIDCAIIDNEVVGFTLSLDGDEIHADPEALPASRGCAQGYKIYAVVRPAEWAMAEGGLVAIISSYPFGFEGPDRRFLAVPLD